MLMHRAPGSTEMDACAILALLQVPSVPVLGDGEMLQILWLFTLRIDLDARPPATRRAALARHLEFVLIDCSAAQFIEVLARRNSCGADVVGKASLRICDLAFYYLLQC